MEKLDGWMVGILKSEIWMVGGFCWKRAAIESIDGRVEKGLSIF